jgi:hypothetical protein
MSASRSGRRLGNEPVRFRFDGREFTGLAGDTAASALLASGVRLFGRSVKYRRPRGVLTAGWDEPNALLTLGVAGQAVPNLPATVLPIAQGSVPLLAPVPQRRRASSMRAATCWSSAADRRGSLRRWPRPMRAPR